MISFTFTERSRLGKVRYELGTTALKISGKRGAHSLSATFALRDISLNIQHLTQRFYFSLVALFGLTLLFATVGVVFIFSASFPISMRALVSGVALIFCGCFIAIGVRWAQPMHLVRFKNRVGTTLFDVIMEKGCTADVEEFVSALRSAVKNQSSSSLS
jgi:hypothetical protein